MDDDVDPLHGCLNSRRVPHVALDRADLAFDVRIVRRRNVKQGYALTFCKQVTGEVNTKNPAPPVIRNDFCIVFSTMKGITRDR